MKELDDESAELLRSMNDRAKKWRSDPGVVVWVFWIGKDQAKAKAWAEEQGVDHLVFGVVSSEEDELLAWNLNPMAKNSLILANRKKQAVVCYTDVTVDDFETLESNLIEILSKK